MVRCLGGEPEPPTDPTELEKWCESGNSGRPIQTHIGDYGTVWEIRENQAVRVEFDDGDERLLYCHEVRLLRV